MSYPVHFKLQKYEIISTWEKESGNLAEDKAGLVDSGALAELVAEHLLLAFKVFMHPTKSLRSLLPLPFLGPLLKLMVFLFHEEVVFILVFVAAGVAEGDAVYFANSINAKVRQEAITLRLMRKNRFSTVQ